MKLDTPDAALPPPHGNAPASPAPASESAEGSFVGPVSSIAEIPFHLLSEGLPNMVWVADENGETIYVNERARHIVGSESLERDRLVTFIHPADREEVATAWRRSLETGETFEVEMRVEDRVRGEYRWHINRAVPTRDERGRVVRWFGTTTDIDDRKRTEAKLRFLSEAGRLLGRSLDYAKTLEAACALVVPGLADWCGLHTLDAKGDLVSRATVHVDPEKISLAKEFALRYPPRKDDLAGAPAVVRTGVSEVAPEIPDSLLDAVSVDDTHRDFLRRLGLRSYMCIPLRSHRGVIGALTLITEGKTRRYTHSDLPFAEEFGARLAMALENAELYERSRKEAESRSKAEASLRAMVATIPQMVWTADPDGTHTFFNERWMEFTGLDLIVSQGEGWRLALHPDDLDRTVRIWKHCLASGVPYEIEYRMRNRAGAYRWILARALPVRDKTTRIVSWYGTCTDIHDQKETEARLRLEKETTQTLHEVGRMVAAELELEKVVQGVTDAVTKLTGAKFGAFFYNQVDAAGEMYTLYTISGVHRDAFSAFPMPRKTQVFGPTFDGTGVLRSDDITADPRYGKNAPHAGMPEGHLPVRSYMGVPVISRDGGVIGGLFVGHPEPGVFDDRAETLAVGIAAHAAIALDNASLVSRLQSELGKRANAEESVRALNSDLERRVAERTSQLTAANKELEAFAYSVSHDLRAPLRGIAGFSNLLRQRYAKVLDEEGLGYLKRVMDATGRMSDLIDDLLMLSRLTRKEMRYQPVDLSTMAEGVVEALRAKEPAREVEVTIEPGLRVVGDAVLLHSAVENLLGNAWKFTAKRGADARIAMRSVPTPEGERGMVIEDNGAGFDMRYADKLFGAFQRLHGVEEFEGSGIGLASVQRVVHRHGGRVWARGAVGEGASFTFTLPSMERTPSP